MKFPRLPHLRTAKFAPVAIFSLFFLTNLTGFYFSPALAPTVSAASVRDDLIPLDILGVPDVNQRANGIAEVPRGFIL